MRGWVVHPKVSRISQFADGALEGRRKTRLIRHLEGCPRCRTMLARLRETDAVIADLPTPPSPPELLEGVFERRNSDVRAILPETTNLGDRRIPSGVLAGIGAVAAGGLVLGSLLAGGVSADSSRLRIGEPAGDGTTEVTYSPVRYLEHADVVRARIEAWFPDEGRAPVFFDEVLSRDGRSFAGSITLPEGAVYGHVVVEDRSGARVDVGQGQLWQVWAEPPGRRSLPTLLTQLRASEEIWRDGLVSSDELRFQTRALTSAYPDSATAWAERAYFDLSLPASAYEQERAREMHEARFAAFLADLHGHEPDPHHLRSLVDYARRLGDTASVVSLVNRLASLDPGSLVVRESAIGRALQQPQAEPAAILELVERDWQEYRVHSAFAAAQGLRSAEAIRDAALAWRWGMRLFQLDPDSRDGIARELASVPGLESDAAVLLEDRLRDADEARQRPLYMSVDEFEGARARRRAQLLGALGVALLRAGQIEEGSAKLEESIGIAWDANVASRLLAQYEAAGADHRSILDLRARLAVDPLAGVNGDSGQVLPASLRRRAREKLIQQLLVGVQMGLEPDHLPEQLGHSQVNLIALWRVVPDPTHPIRDRFNQAAERLTTAGGRAFAVGPDDTPDRIFPLDSDAFEALPKSDRLVEAFHGWYARSYVVLDDGSYSLHHNLDDALRLALLLASDER